MLVFTEMMLKMPGTYNSQKNLRVIYILYVTGDIGKIKSLGCSMIKHEGNNKFTKRSCQ